MKIFQFLLPIIIFIQFGCATKLTTNTKDLQIMKSSKNTNNMTTLTTYLLLDNLSLIRR